LASVYFGGWFFTIFVIAMLGMAAWEYARLFRQGGYQPNTPLVVGGTILFLLLRYLFNFTYNDLLLSILFILAMFWHTRALQRGAERSATDFAISMNGVLYLSFIGAYLISLENLPDGRWWMLLVVPAVVLADSGAYFIGRAFGKHKMAPRVSPGKSWEGYAGGILTSMILTSLLAILWHTFYPQITWKIGLLYGAVLSILTPFGDLGESMLKRQFGIKDSSKLLSAHGGFLDRMDSLLWAGVIGYYLTLIVIR
jgi:phosphatidate cytidylyltransferase